LVHLVLAFPKEFFLVPTAKSNDLLRCKSKMKRVLTTDGK